MLPLLFRNPVVVSRLSFASPLIASRFASTTVERNAVDAIRKTVKPVDSRKTFLIDTYKHLMEKNPVMLFCHHNNLTKGENAHFREEINKVGGKLTILRNNLFQVYLRNAQNTDPAAPIRRSEQNWKHPLLPFFKGPTAAISFSETDPAKVKKVMKLLEKAQDKLFIIGAKVENDAYDMRQLSTFKDLPTKTQMQSELLGLLHVLSGAGLVQTLEAGSNMLYLTLKSHEDNINPNKKEGDEEN
ncbi:unnamed protein product [Kluyveromyces dobzhanskii CBS 2104]|uniref:WGS project CCBQ000000000 data, contig 00106 n=1 Tax=Kluyveromyces dobzhanskii CBS 2104 TaxID=1427455 RepID=A0A0A8L6A3_9SACH|nr:unnamed protein product [Kluyveromyces dobzhanskii CBS 2104]